HVAGEENAYSSPSGSVVGGVAATARATVSAHTAVEPDAAVEALRVALNAENIESRPLWKPMHLQPVFASSPSYVNGVSERLFRRGICLPAGPWVSDADVERIVAAIASAITR
ncbi:MAG: DegT/DnrJ/EryC1/StrS family aminotransferase, partial [Muribaculaceae bacterium]|nr:DegT/DnrJ/EryC1/StrS family aminotransferase [Muribaculaceae bacterium]